MELEIADRFYEAPIGLHIPSVILIILFGGLGDGFVIVMHYTKKTKLPKDIFIFFLAILDLTACILVAPQIPFLGDYIDNWLFKFQFFTIAKTIVQSYLGILVMMAVDRVWAVFFPFKYPVSTFRFYIGLGVIVTISLIVSIVSTIPSINSYRPVKILLRAYYVLAICTAFIVLMISYPMIAIRLYRQKRKIATHSQHPTTTTTIAVSTKVEILDGTVDGTGQRDRKGIQILSR